MSSPPEAPSEAPPLTHQPEQAVSAPPDGGVAAGIGRPRSRRQSAEEMPHGLPPTLVYASSWTWRVLVLAFAVTVLFSLAKKLEVAVIPLLTSLLAVALLHPVHQRFRRLGLSSGVAAAVTVLLSIAVIGGVGFFIVNRASAEYPQLVDQVDKLVQQIQDRLSTGPLRLGGGSVNNIGDTITKTLRDHQNEIVSGVVSASATVAEVLTGVVLTFFLTIFMLYDGPRIWAFLVSIFPYTARDRVEVAGERMWSTLSGYVTGTFIVALFHGVVMGVTLGVVGVPLVAPLALLVFLGSFIPVLGLIIAGALVAAVTLVSNGVTAAVVVVVVLLIENQIESHVLQPFVVGRHVRLHPMAIALTLGAGAAIAGVPGAIFGVPLVAALNAARSVLREDSDDPETPTPPDPDDAEHARASVLRRALQRLRREPAEPPATTPI